MQDSGKDANVHSSRHILDLTVAFEFSNTNSDLVRKKGASSINSGVTILCMHINSETQIRLKV